MDKNRLLGTVGFIGFLVVFNVLSYVFSWPIFLW